MSENDANGESRPLYLGRQPILDQQQQLLAYELLFRNGQANFADVTDGVAATATVISNAFTELGVGDALGDNLGFINVDEHFLFSELLELLPTHSVVLEILETVPPSAEVIARCQELKDKGYTLALDDFIHITPEYAELLTLADIIKVDIQPLSEAELRALAIQLKPYGKRLLAEKVDSREQMELCRSLGFDLFQGYYFAKPTIIAGKKLDHSQLALMRLMGLLLADADTAELEAALKPEPGLIVNLLRLTNSAGSGTLVRITSLKHAITVLGRRQLQRWLQLLLFASGKHGSTRNPLLQLAATRGRLMELLAGAMKKEGSFSDEAFMVGIMSLMPTLLSLPIEEIIAPLPISLRAQEALRDNKGELGELLQLAIASESGTPESVAPFLLALPRITLPAFNHAIAEALTWAAAIARERPED